MESSLGIDDKDPDIKSLLRDLVYADCYHDFNIKFNTLDIFKKISTTIKKNNDELITNNNDIIKYINKNIEGSSITTVYEYFKQTDLLTPVNRNLGNPTLKENEVLDTIFGEGVFEGIRTNLKNNHKEYFNGTMGLPKSNEININIKEKIRRKYKYSAFPTKNNGEYYNIPYSCREVSNNNNFILLDDASFFSFSTLRDEDILLKITKGMRSQNLNIDDINRSYTFYFIKNNENLADPAPKTSFYNKGNQRIKIKILKDKINTNINFPAYSENNEQKNNLFSSINLNITNKIIIDKNNVKKEVIDAKVNYPRKNIYDYNDITSIS